MKLNIGDKELSIKFGYKPTLKSRVISSVVKMSNIAGKDGDIDMEKVEDLLLFLPELLLVGLQVHHPEYRYDYDTGAGKEEQLEMVFNLVERYLEQDDADFMKLFNDLQGALLEDSFLASLFRKEQKKAERQSNLQLVEKTEETEN